MLNLICFCVIFAQCISLGYQQPPDNFAYYQPNVADRFVPQQTIVPGNIYGKPGIHLIPCPHRRALQNVPTYKSQITRTFTPNDNINLTPQSLTEVSKSDSNIESSIIKGMDSYNQGLDPAAAFNAYDDFNEFKTRNSLSVNNDDLMEPIFSDNRDDTRPSSADNVDYTGAAKVGTPLFESPQVQSVTEISRIHYEELTDSELDPKTSGNNMIGKSNESEFIAEVKESADNCAGNNLESTGISNEQTRRFLPREELPKAVNPVSQPKADFNKSKFNYQTAIPKSSALETQRDQEQNKNKEDYLENENTDLSFRDILSSGNIKGKTPQIMIPKTVKISDMEESRMMVMQSSRVCYACSTANNAACRQPDRRTTVKYCRQGHNACITKVFQTAYSEILIRDCNDSCNEPDVTGMVPKYKSCSICHTDLCNGAFSIKSHNIMLVVFIISVTRYFISF